MKRRHFNLRRTMAWLAAMLLLLAVAAGCGADEEAQPGAAATATAVESITDLSEQASEYVTMSRLALAEEFEADAGAIAVEEVTEPDTEDGTYIIILSFAGETFEYHGQGGEVTRVSEPLPAATEMMETAETEEPNFIIEPAAVEEVSVQVDADSGDPIQVRITGNLSNSCEEIFEHSAEMVNDTTFSIQLTTREPADAVCAQALSPFEETIALAEAAGISVDELIDAEYTVIVNDEHTATFNWSDEPAPDTALENPAIDFMLDETVYIRQVSETVATVDGSNGEPFWEIYPEHSMITLEGYAQTDSIYEPQIIVYPVDELIAVNDTAAAEIDALQEILETQPDLTMQETLPYLPLSGAAQITFARADYMEFEHGSGIRYLTQYGQAAEPLNNQELVYTYQGLTEDGEYYVAAVLPVSHPELPVDAETAPAQEEDSYEAYLANAVEQLNAAEGASFTPNLDRLDMIIASLTVQDVRSEEEAAVPEIVAHTEADLVARLEEAGAEVRLSSEPIAAVDILSIPGYVFFVNGEEIQLYVYDTAEAAMEDAARISADASEIAPETVGDAPPTIVDWDGPPHFYRWDNLIVLYVGENSEVLDLLTEVLGEPFAAG